MTASQEFVCAMCDVFGAEFANIFGGIATPNAPDRTGLDVVDSTGVIRGNDDLVSERGNGPDTDLSNACTLGIYPSQQELDALSAKVDRQLHGGRVVSAAAEEFASLTAAEVLELAAVSHGADVWGYANAMLLRSVERKAPSLIRIVDAMEEVSGELRQPYFGAIATKAGRAALARANEVTA